MKNLLAFVPIKLLLNIVLCLWLTGCITVQRFYLTPTVKGNVLDLATLEPLTEVQVSHWEYPQSNVISDIDGAFTLPAKSQVKLEVLMPAHAFTHYPVRLEVSASSTLVMVQASILMRSEETAFVPDVVIDTNSDVIAPSPTPDHNEYAQLMGMLDASERLGKCNKDVGTMAVNTLNLARKLNERLEKSPTSNALQSLTSISYYRVRDLWHYWETTCDRSELNSIQSRDAILGLRELMIELDAESPRTETEVPFNNIIKY